MHIGDDPTFLPNDNAFVVATAILRTGVNVLQVELLPEGTQFRLVRIAAGWTLNDVARRADVSPPRLSEFERGLVSALSPDAVERVRSVLTGTPFPRPAGEMVGAVA
jgi:hypothetical protein